MSLKFIEKEPQMIVNHPYYGTCMMHPIFMVRDGVEHMILERREPQPEQADKLVQRIIKRLKKTNGSYAMYFGEEENIFKLLSDVVDKDKWFKASKHLLLIEEDQNILKFSGSVYGSETSFMYQIFDYKLAETVIQTVNSIQSGKQQKAKDILENFIKKQEQSKYNN